MGQANRMIKPSLLIVESDDMIRNVLISALEKFGYSTIAVDTAEDGSQILNNKRFDVIISDYDLKDTTGLEFLKSLKSVYPDKTNVLMISYGDVENVSETKDYGIHHVIEKPFLFEELLNIIEGVTKNSLVA
jgi:DNA-binding NtrC family response regulator